MYNAHPCIAVILSSLNKCLLQNIGPVVCPFPSHSTVNDHLNLISTYMKSQNQQVLDYFETLPVYKLYIYLL